MRYTTWKMRGKWQNCLLTYNIHLNNIPRVFCEPIYSTSYSLWQVCTNYDSIHSTKSQWGSRFHETWLRIGQAYIEATSKSHVYKETNHTHKKQHLRYLFPLSFSNSTQQAESKLFTFRFAPLYYYRIVCISCRMWKIVVWNSSSHAHECQKENVFLCVYVLYGYLWQTGKNEGDGSSLICSKILKTHCYHTIKTFIALIALIY